LGGWLLGSSSGLLTSALLLPYNSKRLWSREPSHRTAVFHRHSAMAGFFIARWPVLVLPFALPTISAGGGQAVARLTERLSEGQSVWRLALWQSNGDRKRLIFLRVWSWLRMNAGGVPYACKSNGPDVGPRKSDVRWCTL
jgi:hypothetical protein